MLSYAGAKPTKSRTGEKGAGRYELSNLADDPGEKKVLAAEQPGRLKEMPAKLEALKTAGRSRP